MIFEKDKLIVRKLLKKDNETLVKWLSNPDILTFYEGRDNPFDFQKVNQKFFNDDREVTRCIVIYENVSIGYIQFYRVEKETIDSFGYHSEERVFGMDQFIGEVDYWNKGIGTVLVKSMVEYLMDVQEAERIIMDPQTWNTRAIRCYEKAGFQKVKILSKHEFHEGAYRDCWLIEYK